MKTLSTLIALTLMTAGVAHAQLKAPSNDTARPPAPAQAAPQQQQNPFTKDFQTCIQKLQESMQAKKAEDPAGAKACFVAETQRQDAKLGAGMQALSKVVTPAEKKFLDESNAAWQRLRNADCSFYSDPAAGVNEAAGNAECVMNRTTGRALEIDALKTAYLEREAQRKAAQAQAPAKAPAK